MSILEDLHILNKVINTPLNKIAKKAHLTLIEVRVILFLYENKKFDIAAKIVDKLILSKSIVSESVEDLVNKKFIIKIQDLKDKKKYHLKLTNNSQKIIELLNHEINDLKNKLMKNISLEDKENLKRIINQIINNTRELN